MTACATAVLVALAGITITPAVAATPAAASQSTAPADALTPYMAAAKQAQASGQPVEVTSETTETSQVLARPDGKYELTANREPVRIKRDGKWLPINTSLKKLPGGVIAPEASAAHVTFSAGGNTPMVRIAAREGGAVEFHWPDSLPEPELSGDTATYREVLPGVDLQLIAFAESYRQVLVVHDATAAANPRLRKLGITTVTDGLTLETNPNGRLSARNSKGEEVLSAPAPTMWDSTVDARVGEQPSARSTGSGKVTKLGVNQVKANGLASRASAGLELTPPASALDSADVRYPVYIDPSMNGARVHVLTVQSGGWDYYDDADEPMRVGYCDWPGCTSSNGVARSYFSVPTTALIGKPTTAKVYTATVYVNQIHQGAGCGSPQSTDLWSANPFGSATNFGGPRSSKLDTDAKDFGDQCSNSGNLIFNNASVLAYVQGAASGDKQGLNFGLSAPDEGNRNQWKKFANRPSLSATFDFPPSVPANIDIASNVACPDKANYVRDTTPTVYASAIDYNPNPGSVGLHFEVHNNPSNGNAQRYNTTAVAAPSNVKTAWTTNSANSNIKAGVVPGNYALRVKASSLSPDTADQFSGFSPWYYFTVDYAPPTVPTIASFDYPQSYWGAPQNTPGVFSFKGSTDTAGFTYSFDTSGGEPLPIDTTCAYTTTPAKAGGMVTANAGAADITVPATLTPGYHTMYVKGFDAAHNVSAQSIAYVFYVSPIFAGTGATQIEAESITPTQPDGQGDLGYNNGHGYPVYVEYPSSTPLSATKQSHLAATGGTPTAPARFDYSINAPFEAYYALGVQITTSMHYGKLAFELDHTPIKQNDTEVVADGYTAVRANKYVPLGGARLLKGPHTLTVKVIDANPSSIDYVYNGTFNGVTITNLHSHGHSAGIDFFTVVPINNVTYASLSDAFNNNGISSDGQAAGDIGPSQDDAALSLQELAAKGFVPGSLAPPLDADGLRFQLPAQRADGADNAIASGQTVTLPAQSTANFVNLLVASTCGATPTGANIQLSMNHVNPANPDGELLITDTPISSVPDWRVGVPPTNDAQVTLATTLDYYNRGTGRLTDYKVKLYRLKVPVKPGYEGMPIKSITMPSLGTNFTQACNTAGLHVFAVATSS